MYPHVKDREEELKLLDFAKKEAGFHKELIAELEAFEVETKPNGTIHKTKENRRLKLIKELKTDLKKMKKFYLDRITEPEHWSSKRYSTSKHMEGKRDHLTGIKVSPVRR